MPSKPGVYEFLDQKYSIIYIGKAIDLKNRVSSYFTSTHLGEKTRLMVTLISHIRITAVESELEALLLEAYYIKKHKPKFNVRLTDNKNYILVAINLTQKYPPVVLTRSKVKANNLYFGPFPNSSSVKLVLRTIRKVFPYQSVKNHPKRKCLYYHLGLCPCPPVFDSLELQKSYQQNIKGLIRIFKGQTKKIIREFSKKRDFYSKQELFEQASDIQKKIDALSYITQPFREPLAYAVNPNLRIDIRQEEIKELTEVLIRGGCLIDNLRRIECYDISNIHGKQATGSMVVFKDGEKDSQSYRKFKIRRDWLKNNTSNNAAKMKLVYTVHNYENSNSYEKPNDFAMIAEVLTRRLKHHDWEFPGLIIIDGGKGQVSACLNTLHSFQMHIPLIGLAKREETIVIPQVLKDNSLNFREITLPKDAKALHLLMRIRDEAHRFAITYHRKLRSKSIMK